MASSGRGLGVVTTRGWLLLVVLGIVVMVSAMATPRELGGMGGSRHCSGGTREGPSRGRAPSAAMTLVIDVGWFGDDLDEVADSQQLVTAAGKQVHQQVDVAAVGGVAARHGTKQPRVRGRVPTENLVELATVLGDRCAQRLAVPGDGVHGARVRAERWCTEAGREVPVRLHQADGRCETVRVKRRSSGRRQPCTWSVIAQRVERSQGQAGSSPSPDGHAYGVQRSPR